MPVIKRRIEDELGIKPIFWEHSQTAVALGAATFDPRSFLTSQPVSSSRERRPPQVQKKYSREVISAPSNSSAQTIDICNTNRPPKAPKEYTKEVISPGSSSTPQTDDTGNTTIPPKVPKETGESKPLRNSMLSSCFRSLECVPSFVWAGLFFCIVLPMLRSCSGN
jgi:hypothetical protein